MFDLRFIIHPGPIAKTEPGHDSWHLDDDDADVYDLAEARQARKPLSGPSQPRRAEHSTHGDPDIIPAPSSLTAPVPYAPTKQELLDQCGSRIGVGMTQGRFIPYHDFCRKPWCEKKCGEKVRTVWPNALRAKWGCEDAIWVCYVAPISQKEWKKAKQRICVMAGRKEAHYLFFSMTDGARQTGPKGKPGGYDGSHYILASKDLSNRAGQRFVSWSVDDALDLVRDILALAPPGVVLARKPHGSAVWDLPDPLHPEAKEPGEKLLTMFDGLKPKQLTAAINETKTRAKDRLEIDIKPEDYYSPFPVESRDAIRSIAREVVAEMQSADVSGTAFK